MLCVCIHLTTSAFDQQIYYLITSFSPTYILISYLAMYLPHTVAHTVGIKSSPTDHTPISNKNIYIYIFRVLTWYIASLLEQCGPTKDFATRSTAANQGCCDTLIACSPHFIIFTNRKWNFHNLPQASVNNLLHPTNTERKRVGKCTTGAVWRFLVISPSDLNFVPWSPVFSGPQ